MTDWLRWMRGAPGPMSGSVARLLCAFALLGASACDETAPPTRPGPSFQVGLLQGYVRVAGKPVSVAIGARSTQGSGTIVAQTRSDSTGWYQLGLPPDLYRIELDPRGGGFRTSDTRSVVRVATGVQRLDIWRGTLTVRLTLPASVDGQRIECTLEPRDFLEPIVSSVVAGHRAELIFPSVRPGWYRISVRTPSATFWLPGTLDERRADSVLVQAWHPTVYERRLQDQASISGTVSGSWQEAGASRPLISAYALSTQRFARTSADAEGAFALDIFDVQPCKILVSISNVDRWIGGGTFETATVFQPRAGEILGGVTFVEGGILCQLQGPGSLLQHQSEYLLLDDEDASISGSRGYGNEIPICNLRSGSYKLYVHGDCSSTGEPWASQWYDRADSAAAATRIEVTEGRLTRITLRLESDGRIEGRISTAAGEPVPAELRLYRNGLPLCPNIYYSSPSTFSLRGLGNGDYTLAAGRPNRLWWYPGTAFADSARVISIRNHGTAGGIDVRLPPDFAQEQP